MSLILRSIRRTPITMVRSYSKINFPEQGYQRQEDSKHREKPKIGDFKNPLLHTFLVASSTCLILHSVWLRLEFEEEEEKLHRKSRDLEDAIQKFVDEKKSELVSESKRWYHYLWK